MFNHFTGRINLMNFVLKWMLFIEANQVVHISYIVIIYFTKTSAGSHGDNEDGTLNKN